MGDGERRQEAHAVRHGDSKDRWRPSTLNGVIGRTRSRTHEYASYTATQAGASSSAVILRQSTNSATHGAYPFG
jgi:hypothetical protein